MRHENISNKSFVGCLLGRQSDQVLLLFTSSKPIIKIISRAFVHLSEEADQGGCGLYMGYYCCRGSTCCYYCCCCITSSAMWFSRRVRMNGRREKCSQSACIDDVGKQRTNYSKYLTTRRRWLFCLSFVCVRRLMQQLQNFDTCNESVSARK